MSVDFTNENFGVGFSINKEWKLEIKQTGLSIQVMVIPPNTEISKGDNFGIFIFEPVDLSLDMDFQKYAKTSLLNIFKTKVSQIFNK
jgi:hypothetical protein